MSVVVEPVVSSRVPPSDVGASEARSLCVFVAVAVVAFVVRTGRGKGHASSLFGGDDDTNAHGQLLRIFLEIAKIRSQIWPHANDLRAVHRRDEKT